MTKTKDLADTFLKLNQSPVAPMPRSPISAFHSLFAVKTLPERDEKVIEQIFANGSDPDFSSEALIQSDLLEVKQITQELKAIRKQEMILIGERISKARTIFKNYKERSFREWLEFLFGSFKTGYNYLSFYDLYGALPDELKDGLKEMPAKAAYVLASKRAPIEVKAEIVKEHSKESSSRLIALIQEALGEGRRETPEESIDKIIRSIQNLITRLSLKEEQIEESHREKIEWVIGKLEQILKTEEETHSE